MHENWLRWSKCTQNEVSEVEWKKKKTEKHKHASTWIETILCICVLGICIYMYALTYTHTLLDTHKHTHILCEQNADAFQRILSDTNTDYIPSLGSLASQRASGLQCIGYEHIYIYRYIL